MKRLLAVGATAILAVLLFAPAAQAAEDRPLSDAEKYAIVKGAVEAARSSSEKGQIYSRARCTAECGNGAVSCDGEVCVAIDGVGCGAGDIETDENDVIRTC